MHGTASHRRNTIAATLVCQALLIVSAGSELACDNPTLSRLEQQPALTGYYTVTMTAAGSCSLPDYAMARSYIVLFRQEGENVQALLNPYGPFAGDFAGFTGMRDGETFHFLLNGDYPEPANGYLFINLVNGTDVGYTGTAAGTMGVNGLLTSFDGKVLLYNHSDRTVLAACDARDHRMEVVPGVKSGAIE